MKPILLAFALSCSVTASFGAELKPVMLEDGRIVQMVVASKQPFAVRHPKLHKVGRKVRKLCQVSLPIVQFAGGLAQVITAIR